MFISAAAIINGAYWSSRLDETFKSNYLADPSITWQYFCSGDGYFRIFPGKIDFIIPCMMCFANDASIISTNPAVHPVNSQWKKNKLLFQCIY